jgi:hypothetical protein
MVAKISGTHRKAFLKALAETGNIMLAADQVRVSRDWVYKLRRRDAGFAAECREALAEFHADSERPLHRSALPSGPPPSAGIPSAHLRRWSLEASSAHPAPHRREEQIVLQRGNGRRVQVKRARPGQWNRETEQRFLAALMGSRNVSLAAAEAGKSAFAAYYHRRRDPGFARRWDEAIEIGMCELEAVLIQNACHFLNPHDAPVPDQLLDGMSVQHAIDIAQMNRGKARGLGRKEED